MPKTYTNDDQFMIYTYKIKLCTRTDSHSWKHCPWRHAGEVSAQRRHPSMHRPVMCMNMRLAGECAEGDACPFSHNAFELSLHPERYKTTLCNLKDKCNRELCFFAHSEQDVRTPEPALPPPCSAGTSACSSAAAAAASPSRPHMLPAAGAPPGPQLRSGYIDTAAMSPSLGVLQQQQQQNIVFVPLSTQQQPQQQVCVLQAPQFPAQQQGMWTVQQQVPQVQAMPPQLGASNVGSATSAPMMTLSSPFQAAAAAGMQAGDSSTVMVPGAPAAVGFISRAFAGSAGRGGGRSSFEAMVRQDLTKFGSFTMQGVQGVPVEAAPVQQQQQQQQPPQVHVQAGVVQQGLANLDVYADALGHLSLVNRGSQQPVMLVQQHDVSFTSQGGNSGPIQWEMQQPQLLQQGQPQPYVLMHQDLGAFDSFTSQASAGRHSSGPYQQQAQQEPSQLMFGATYSTPYYDPSHSEASTTTNMATGGSSVHALQPLSMPDSLGDPQIPVYGYFQVVQDPQGAILTQSVGGAGYSGSSNPGASGINNMGGL